MLEVLPSQLLWTFLGNFKACGGRQEFFRKLLGFLSNVLKASNGHGELAASALAEILSQPIFADLDPLIFAFPSAKKSLLESVSQFVAVAADVSLESLPALANVVNVTVDAFEAPDVEKSFIKSVFGSFASARSQSTVSVFDKLHNGLDAD